MKIILSVALQVEIHKEGKDFKSSYSMGAREFYNDFLCILVNKDTPIKNIGMLNNCPMVV